jgi:GntR family transcriptional repressor for pyruvate dehydrogenase complex
MLELNQKSVAHLADLRLWLETMSITRAIEEGTDAEIAECEEALVQLRDAAGDTAAWMSADTNFHAAIARATHNPYLTSLFESVHATLISYEYCTWIEENTTPRWLRSTEVSAMSALHDPIVAALRNRDEEAGRVAVLHHHYVMAQHLATAHR